MKISEHNVYLIHFNLHFTILSTDKGQRLPLGTVFNKATRKMSHSQMCHFPNWRFQRKALIKCFDVQVTFRRRLNKSGQETEKVQLLVTAVGLDFLHLILSCRTGSMIVKMRRKRSVFFKGKTLLIKIIVFLSTLFRSHIWYKGNSVKDHPRILKMFNGSHFIRKTCF